MPAKSVTQAIASRMALAAKLGKLRVDKLKGAALRMYRSMSVDQLRDFAQSSTRGLPKKVKKKKK